ncbi:high mobility group protein B1-like protein [Cricetulus griseus]|uniref:High mobility group protein B1-like protein n=1 Tax=Cricetulus griseus TaxID=10029 RepID=A0A061IIH1_CRIGR|nr:high mobility group protein B1-like protein [Cricetulus griseus]
MCFLFPTQRTARDIFWPWNLGKNSPCDNYEHNTFQWEQIGKSSNAQIRIFPSTLRLSPNYSGVVLGGWTSMVCISGEHGGMQDFQAISLGSTLKGNIVNSLNLFEWLSYEIKSVNAVEESAQREMKTMSIEEKKKSEDMVIADKDHHEKGKQTYISLKGEIKKFKDPSALKRPLWALFLFCSEYHAQIKQNHPALSIVGAAKKLGQQSCRTAENTE